MTPDKVQARKMVLVSTFLLAAVSVYKNKDTNSTFKSLWGVGVVGLVLSLLADFAPSIAGPFAVLVVLGSLTEKGNNLIQSALGKAAGTTGTAPPSSAPAAPAAGSSAPHAVTVPAPAS